MSVRNGVAPVLIRCDLATGRCTGTIRLQSRRTAGAAAAAMATRTVTYGTGKIDIAAGRQARVKVRLSKHGRRLVRAHKRTKVWLSATVGGKRLAASRLTLTR